LTQRIAVIGSGISGLVSAYLLARRYEVTLFEVDDYLGGHTHTHDIVYADQSYALDTGFIVFNKKTYPNFCKLLEKLAVPIQKSEMSFSFTSEKMGLEYCGSSINALFSDRRNLIKPAFYKMVKDISRFNKNAKAHVQNQSADVSVADFIAQHNYRDWFTNAYFIPMTAAIWSTKPGEIMQSPVNFILNFFANHGLLDVVNRPQWYIIAGGSRNYIPALMQDFSGNIHLNTRVTNVRRQGGHIVVHADGAEIQFDAVVMAVHSDQALALLEQPTPDEAAILGAIPYQENEAILHHDRTLLPKNPRAWASWNYSERNTDLTTLTYYMNKLQNITAPVDFCVSLNQTELIAPEKILKRLRYAHPCFTTAAIAAQQRQDEINGADKIYYCGAYWKYGFHEDGVSSAMDVCRRLGVEL
jgi:predicted NAD/FAD-binding protein